MASFNKLNKNVLLIVGAIGFGLLAALLSVSYIQQKAEEARAAATPDARPEMQVVVPVRDIAPGEHLQTSVLSTRSVPVDFVPADALLPANYEQHIGRVSRQPLKQGAPISAGAMVALHEQFSSVVRPGAVGYTFSVNENNSISGMVSPGDRIDILMTYSPTQAGNQSSAGGQPDEGGRVVPLLENILVLATGAVIQNVPGETGAGGFSSVTLELEPQQAEQLTIAQETGKMRVVLRNLDDRTPFGLSGLTEKALLSEYESAGGSSVHFIIGGRN